MPRFYTTTIHPRSLSNELLNNYKKIASYNETLFYTQQGIYEIKNGKLYKINVKTNDTVLHHNIQGFDIIEDNYEKDNPVHVISQLPYDYFVKRNELTKYALDNSTLVVVKTGEYFTDFYIESDKKCSHISQDIVSFLSRLN